MIKLFATDLDGTLLNRNSQVSPENAAAIQRAKQEGLEVTIATGRVYSDVINISRDGGIKTPVIDPTAPPSMTRTASAFSIFRWTAKRQHRS